MSQVRRENNLYHSRLQAGSLARQTVPNKILRGPEKEHVQPFVTASCQKWQFVGLSTCFEGNKNETDAGMVIYEGSLLCQLEALSSLKDVTKASVSFVMSEEEVDFQHWVF